MAEDEVPRRGTEPDNVRALAKKVDELQKEVSRLAKSASLRNASISGGDGLAVKDESGNVVLRLTTDAGAIIAYGSDGSEFARYGRLAHSAPGDYGVETKAANGAWSKVGAGVATWANLDGKPTEFNPTAHNHPGSAIIGNVAGANVANWTPQADGSSRAFNNPVGGNTFYAVWVGNDGNFNLGRNTSSARYKDNIRDFTMDLSDLLQVRPVLFDYKDTFDPAVDVLTGEPAEGPPRRIPGAKDQYGFIAEELVEVWPEVIQYFDHGDGNGPVIDGIRYDLVAARLVPILQGMLIMGRTARTRLVELQADVTEAQTQLGQARTALTNQAAKIKALEERLTKAGL